MVAAHYTGLRSGLLGKGTGHKPHDLCVADLCQNAITILMWLAAATVLTEDRQSEQFLFNIIKTIMRVDQGIVKIEGLKDG